MQENNFEKQVQEKMEDLRIDPSGESWEKVSARIGKRKRDNRILLGCLSALLLLLVGGLTWINTTSNDKSKLALAEAKKSNLETVEQSTPANTTSITSDSNESIQQEIPGGGIKEATVTKDAATKTQLAGQTLRNHKYPGTKSEGKRFNQSDKPGPRSIPSSKQNSTQQPEMVVENPVVTSDRSTASKSRGKPNVAIDYVDEAEQTREEPVQDPTASTEHLLVANPLLLISDEFRTTGATVTAKNFYSTLPKTPKSTRWKSGLTVSGGISTTRNGYLGIISNSGSENKDMFESPPANNTGNNGTPSSPASGLGSYQSPVQMKTGFIAGAYVQRELSRKASVQVGLNYKYYSTSMLTGSRIDSFGSGSADQQMSSSYYRAGRQQKYINRYHFLELPLGLQVRINPIYKRPIYLYAGINISRLIKTNTLQFNNTNSTYFRNDEVLNKMQFDLSSKLLFALGRGRNSLLLGPQLNYSLGKMSDSGIYQNRRYSYLGLTLQKNIF